MLIQTILKTRRINNHYTQEQIAQKLHVTTQAVSKWETGQSIPSIDNLLMLSDLYNVSIDELIQGSPYFKKPQVVGKIYNLKKGILFCIVWTCFSLLLTGFGYQPFWLFSAIIFISLLLVFPIIFSDYWIINQQDIMVHQFSRNPILKIIECIKNSSTQIKIPYSEIESIEIIYTKKIRASAFDSSPDYFYLLVTYNNQTTKLYLDIYAKRFLPQFIAFLSRQRITIIDKSEIIELLVSDTSLYQHFNEKNVATDNRK